MIEPNDVINRILDDEKILAKSSGSEENKNVLARYKKLGQAQAAINKTCTIKITSSPEERSFSPGKESETGYETFTAKINGIQPKGSSIEWGIFKDDPNKPLSDKGRGTVALISGVNQLSNEVVAKRPNKGRISVAVKKNGNMVCFDNKEISVPQFFWIVVNESFFKDLERLGLRRRPIVGLGVLTGDQANVNFDVMRAVLDEAFNTARFLFKSINVRFTESYPGTVVGENNYTSIVLGGKNNIGTSASGITLNSTHPMNYDQTDKGNLQPNQRIVIYSGEYAIGRPGVNNDDPIFKSIFNLTSVENYQGTPLGGIAVDAGEFSRFPRSPRQKVITAAVSAYGRLLGSTIAHEAGHSLGLPHPESKVGALMDEGFNLSFSNSTGITSFDPQTGKIQIDPPQGFSNSNLRKLREILPVLRT